MRGSPAAASKSNSRVPSELPSSTTTISYGGSSCRRIRSKSMGRFARSFNVAVTMESSGEPAGGSTEAGSSINKQTPTGGEGRPPLDNVWAHDEAMGLDRDFDPRWARTNPSPPAPPRGPGAARAIGKFDFQWRRAPNEGVGSARILARNSAHPAGFARASISVRIPSPEADGCPLGCRVRLSGGAGRDREPT